MKNSQFDKVSHETLLDKLEGSRNASRLQNQVCDILKRKLRLFKIMLTEKPAIVDGVLTLTLKLNLMLIYRDKTGKYGA